MIDPSPHDRISPVGGAPTQSVTAEQTTLGSETGSAPREPLPLARGSGVGRYVVLDRHGAGAMGVVYAAYDPELDRKVAIKVLRPSPDTSADTSSRAVLLREAQAMAKLSHPNVITVHDVGELDERLWIAMEFVDGVTFREWRSAAPRSWREVLARTTASARGLAAAHAAGLVHGDFKPDNVMIGADGRVRVMDFGLARPEHSQGPPINGVDARVSGSASTELSRDATIMGGRVGTPAYMAPEQYGSGVIDARADQFALCVTAWEALYGERPYRGGSLAELSANVIAGRIREAPSGTRVPGWLRSVVRRGLSAAPADRWPSTDELVRALERGGAQARTRRRLALVGGIAVAGISGFAAHRFDMHRRVAACQAEGARIEEVWSDDARTTVYDALLATRVAYAETTANNVVSWLDMHATAWRSARTDACIDRDVRGTADPPTYERGLWCLDERRMELEALAVAFAHADAQVVQRAVPAVATLVSPDHCRDPVLLERGPPPPTERVDEVRAIRADVSRAQVLDQTGAYAQGLQLARSARERAAVLQWPPLSATALAVEARMLMRSGEYADAERVGIEAYREAARAGAWRLAAQAASNLIYVSARRTRYHEGETWGIHAEVALVHGGGDVAIEEAVRLANLGMLRMAAGDYARAAAAHEGALSLRERSLGREHPIVASSLVNLANVHFHIGDYATARQSYERALAIQERSFGPDHPEVATTLNNLGSVFERTNDVDSARRFFERSLEIRERALGPNHPDVAASLNNLATIHEAANDDTKAIELIERALQIWERALGPNHPDVVMALGNLARVDVRNRRYVRARESLTRAVAIIDTVGTGHPLLASLLISLGEVALELDDASVALGAAERAVAIVDAEDGVQFDEANARFLLARALVTTSGDRARARALARQAREQLHAPNDAPSNQAARIDRWLAEHGDE